MDKHKRRLELQLDRWQRRLPRWATVTVRWLRKPSSRWVRIPVGLLLVGAGLVGFLPVLGFWMAIPGLLLLAIDIQFLRLPIGVVLVRVRRKWRLWRRRHAARRD